MRTGRLVLQETQEVVVPRVRRTTTYWERMRGLLWAPPLQAGEGLLVTPCSEIHTWGMACPIDVVFLDRKMWIRKLVEAVKPWGFARCRKAIHTLELPAGTIAATPALDMFEMLEWHEAD